MKPKDLPLAFTWENRKVIFKDGIWCVPSYYDHYDSFAFPGWDHSGFFKKKQDVCVEYCSGNGHWIVEKALKNPDLNWVAVEKRFDRCRKIWSKMKNQGLDNLLIICADAMIVTENYFPDQSIEEIYINFPDPWPKKRHTKHRLIKKTFLDQMGRILKKGASINLVTDDWDYLQNACLCIEDSFFEFAFPEPFYVTALAGYGTSYFDQLWRKLGRKIYYLRFSLSQILMEKGA